MATVERLSLVRQVLLNNFFWSFVEQTWHNRVGDFPAATVTVIEKQNTDNTRNKDPYRILSNFSNLPFTDIKLSSWLDNSVGKFALQGMGFRAIQA